MRTTALALLVSVALLGGCERGDGDDEADSAGRNSPSTTTSPADADEDSATSETAPPQTAPPETFPPEIFEEGEFAEGDYFGNGMFGRVLLEGSTYGAVDRACDRTGDGQVTFELVDGETKQVLELVLVPQGRSAYATEFFSDGQLVVSGTATVTSENADVTAAEGELEAGNPVRFELVIAGAC